MRYLVHSNIFSESYLWNLAKSLFAGIRQDPIAPYCLERGESLQYEWFGFDITASIWADQSNPNVQIEQVDFHTLNLILPCYEHWDSYRGVVKAPKWLAAAAANISPESLECFNPLWPIYASEVTLSQLAQCSWGSEESIAKRISNAVALGSSGSHAQQLLAASLISSEGSPSEWTVDMRGYMLSSIVSANS